MTGRTGLEFKNKDTRGKADVVRGEVQMIKELAWITKKKDPRKVGKYLRAHRHNITVWLSGQDVTDRMILRLEEGNTNALLFFLIYDFNGMVNHVVEDQWQKQQARDRQSAMCAADFMLMMLQGGKI